jgi:hypothetical protein
VLLGEHPAPGLAEDVVPVTYPEVVDEVRELADEQLHGPEVRPATGQMRGLAVAELIVENDGAPAGAEVLERQEVVVYAARTSVQGHEGRRPAAGARLFEVPEDPVPRAEALEVGPALGCRLGTGGRHRLRVTWPAGPKKGTTSSRAGRRPDSLRTAGAIAQPVRAQH